MKKILLAAAVVVLAACGNKDNGTPELIVEPPETHGSVGDLKWEFDLRADHLLIKGAGEMPDFENPNTREYIKQDKNTAPWRPWRNRIKDVELEKGVLSIGCGAFAECPWLTKVTLPDGIQDIGHRAFRNCVNLESMNFPYGMNSIAPDAFEGCTKFRTTPEVLIDGGQIDNMRIQWKLWRDGKLEIFGDGSIPDYPLGAPWDKNADKVLSIVIDGGKHTEKIDGINSIGDNAFYGCRELRSVDMSPYIWQKIGEEAFGNCAQLREVKLPEHLRRIESHAFAGCDNLEGVWLNHDIEYIAPDAFDWCPNLDNIGEGLDGNTEWAITKKRVLLVECKGDMHLKRDVITHINDPFWYYRELVTSVVLSDKVTSIDTSAFSDFINLRSVILSKNLVTIGEIAFGARCVALESITIPAKVTTIGRAAFPSCRKLADVTCLAAVPPTLGENNFDELDDDVLHVPAASIDAYRAAPAWSKAFGQIVAII